MPSYSVKDIDGHAVASYRGQEKRSRSRAATPVISIGHADGRPGKGAPVLPAERNADGALAMGFVGFGANRVAFRRKPTAAALARVRGSTRSEGGSIANRLPWENLFSRNGNIPSLPRV